MIYTDGIHIIGDSKRELDAFVAKIGLPKHWRHKGARKYHYDLYSADTLKRKSALECSLDNGAILLSTRNLILIVQYLKSGYCGDMSIHPLLSESIKRVELLPLRSKES